MGLGFGLGLGCGFGFGFGFGLWLWLGFWLGFGIVRIHMVVSAAGRRSSTRAAAPGILAAARAVAEASVPR